MKRAYTHLILVLFLAVYIYGICQKDDILSFGAMAVILASFLLRLNSWDRQFRFMAGLSPVVILLVSVIAGIVWRIIFPPPEEASAVYLDLFSSFQSACVIAAVFFWLRPFTEKNFFWIFALAWAATALSINVPFDQTKQLTFQLFCILSVAVLLIHTLKKPKNKRRSFLHYRHLLVYGLIVMVSSGALFSLTSKGLVAFDNMFMSFVGDYLIPRRYTNFLNISPTLKLVDPGYSARDKRPVLEIEAGDFPMMYLKTQIFETYRGGVWEEAEKGSLRPLPEAAPPLADTLEIIMFTRVDNIVPTPYSINSISGLEEYALDGNHIIHADDKKRTRIVEVGSSYLLPPTELSKNESARLTRVPAGIHGSLVSIAESLSGEARSDYEAASSIMEYFHKNFQYTLNVNFRSDQKGIMNMIREKRPAYCSYFATAMTFLVRAKGIPARLAVGFTTSERVGPGKNRFLARVKHAHAWSEVYLPVGNRMTGERYMAWVPFDPTPSNARNVIEDAGSRFDLNADRIWLFFLRTFAHLQNFDKDKAKKGALVVLILVLLLINARKIIGRLTRFKLKRTSPGVTKTEAQKKHRDIYQRYLNYLKVTFGEARRDTDTDEQVLQRLRKREEIPRETVSKVESFVHHYRDARFGRKEDIPLQDIIGALEKSGTAS